MKKQTLNIFEILSVYDKELVHSAMIKFFMVHYNEFSKEYFGIEQFDIIELEKSIKVAGKRIRYDIMVYDNEKKPIMIIENKFKATPTTKQLELYDKSFNECNNIKKILMVFMKQQIPSVVQEYCENNKWNIKAYFDIESSESLYNYLKNSNNNKMNDLDLNFIIDSYKNFLEKYFNDINEIVNKKNYVPFNPINRFIHSQYLAYIQSKIANKAKINFQKDFEMTNDGGGNTIPSVAFWSKVTSSSLKEVVKYIAFGIDGDSIKISIHYLRSSNKEVVEEIINNTITKFKPIVECCKILKFQEKRRSVNQKNGSEVGKTSCYSFFTCIINNSYSIEDIVEESATLMVSVLDNEFFK